VINITLTCIISYRPWS